MSPKETHALIDRYYRAFNDDDHAGMLACLAESVQHDINQGGRESGRVAFAQFLARMSRCYREQLSEVVIMVHPDGKRAAAEYIVSGTYLVADEGLPPAHGQRYQIPGIASFELADGVITRISNYYNLNEWIQQVSA